MDPFSWLKPALENGWRLGLVMLLVGASVPLLDRFDLPHSGALKDYSGPSTVIAIIGLAVLIVSLVGRGVEAISANRATRAEIRAENTSVLANVQTLSQPELVFLRAGLERRFELEDTGLINSLIRKRIFVFITDIGRNRVVCEVHGALAADREELLPALRIAAESENEFVSVHKNAGRWTVVE
jgi:hypothetical protein